MTQNIYKVELVRTLIITKYIKANNKKDAIEDFTDYIRNCEDETEDAEINEKIKAKIANDTPGDQILDLD